MEKEFKEGQLVAYCPTDSEKDIYRVELGIFKRYSNDRTSAFVYYSMGATAACTPLDLLYPIQNDYCVQDHLFNSLWKGETEK